MDQRSWKASNETRDEGDIFGTPRMPISEDYLRAYSYQEPHEIYLVPINKNKKDYTNRKKNITTNR